ncbi:MAG: tyrosine-type recombinase/integrase [Bacteroidetes bacterium]|nr:tyrosine-type recombinase/integrase [Bacteroidota bacterium]
MFYQIAASRNVVFRGALKKVCRKVGMDEKVHFHSLRHSFASTLVQKGVNLYSVKELLGHSSITTTEVYSHLNMAALHEAVEVLNAA